jgi:hypothetical protein
MTPIRGAGGGRRVSLGPALAGGAVVNPRRHEFVCLVEFSGVGVLGLEVIALR